MIIAVNSGPGTGKTYTATSITRYMMAADKSIFLSRNQYTEQQHTIWDQVSQMELPKQPRILFAAYSNTVIPATKKMLPEHVTCSTVHGAGYRELKKRWGYLALTSSRGYTLVEQMTGRNFYSLPDRFMWLSALKYAEKCKEEMVAPSQNAFDNLRLKYEDLATLTFTDEVIGMTKKLLLEMKDIEKCRTTGIEFIDQVWLPLWFVKTPPYDLGIIDECQDLSAARLALCRCLCKNLVFVGDPNQAINAFSGADAYAFKRIQDISSTELPLKLSFRLPPNIISKANRLIPTAGLKGTNKPTGVEKTVSFSDLPKMLSEPYVDNLVVCRYNAPLISCALKLLKANIPCYLKGDRVVKALASIVKGRNAVDLDELSFKLDRYEDQQLQKVDEWMSEQIRDKLDCIRAVIKTCSRIDEVEPALKSFYKSPRKDSVPLCTIHAAKGLEAPNVFILFPPVESPRARTPEAKEQELHLHFVAITRTKSNLYWVEE